MKRERVNNAGILILGAGIRFLFQVTLAGFYIGGPWVG